MNPHPNIISIASGKGGVGKTWCAVNLSYALAARGKKVLLVDADLGLANVDIQLGLTPTTDIAKFLSGQAPVEACLTRYNDNLTILAGRSGSGGLASLPASQLALLRNTLHDLASSYDVLFLDLGAGIDRLVRSFASSGATSLVILTPEPTSLTDAYAFIKVMRDHQPSPALKVVVNMADSKEDGEKAYKTLAKACLNFLKFTPPLVGIIRRDRMVVDSIRQQKPLLLTQPNSNAAADLNALATIL